MPERKHTTSVSLKNPLSIFISKRPHQCSPLFSAVTKMFLFPFKAWPSLRFSFCVFRLQAVVCHTWLFSQPTLGTQTGLNSFGQQSEHNTIPVKGTCILSNKYAYSKPTNHCQSLTSVTMYYSAHITKTNRKFVYPILGVSNLFCIPQSPLGHSN